jgi:hypothetical protein
MTPPGCGEAIFRADPWAQVGQKQAKFFQDDSTVPVE